MRHTATPRLAKSARGRVAGGRLAAAKGKPAGDGGGAEGRLRRRPFYLTLMLFFWRVIISATQPPQ